MKITKAIYLVLILTIAIFTINIYAEEPERPIDEPEDVTPASAPTNRSYIVQLFNDYKNAIETKSIDKYLNCFSKSFSKEMVDISRGYTNRFYFTYPDIEQGVKEDNFSQYQGKTVTVNCIIKNIKFDFLYANIDLDLVTQITGSPPKTEKRAEKFKLLWNEEKKKWEVVSF